MTHDSEGRRREAQEQRPDRVRASPATGSPVLHEPDRLRHRRRERRVPAAEARRSPPTNHHGPKPWCSCAPTSSPMSSDPDTLTTSVADREGPRPAGADRCRRRRTATPRRARRARRSAGRSCGVRVPRQPRGVVPGGERDARAGTRRSPRTTLAAPYTSPVPTCPSASRRSISRARLLNVVNPPSTPVPTPSRTSRPRRLSGPRRSRPSSSAPSRNEPSRFATNVAVGHPLGAGARATRSAPSAPSSRPLRPRRRARPGAGRGAAAGSRRPTLPAREHLPGRDGCPPP